MEDSSRQFIRRIAASPIQTYLAAFLKELNDRGDEVRPYPTKVCIVRRKRKVEVLGVEDCGNARSQDESAEKVFSLPKFSLS